MIWFSHKHYWRPKTNLNTVWRKGLDKPVAGLIVEDCLCGAVRTIEFEPGHAPVIRIATPPSEHQT